MHVVTLCLMAAAVAASEPEAVILEFTAPDRCPPCQQIAPLVSRLKREGFPIQIIDADQNVFRCQQHRVISIPTFVLLIAGREVDRIEGKPPEQELRRMCERARLANAAASAAAAAAVTKTQVPEADSAVEKPEARSLKPQTERGGQGETPAESAAPVIRAKHDDSENLPLTTSTNLLDICPRIRVKDALGVNFGTGTIIDSRAGRTTILTCGHLFRKLDEKSVIEVDLFHGDKHETFIGRVLRYDLEADVGVLWIPTTRELPVAAIAGLSGAATVGQHVFSIGCSGGERPTKLQHRVTALNRYLGPDNVECSGVPIQGRSGGGLFDVDGRLIGVCIAADQRDQRGLYAGLKPIHELLDQLKLSYLYPRSESRPVSESLATSEPAMKEFAVTELAPPPRTRFAAETGPVFDEEPAAENSTGTTSPFAATARLADAQTLDEETHAIASQLAKANAIAANSAEFVSDFDPHSESEVVCIIRPLNNPRAASRVVIINRASSKFLSQLSSELSQQAQPTSALVKKPVLRDSDSATAAPRAYRRTREPQATR
jgi:S1-C subfamily serine protease